MGLGETATFALALYGSVLSTVTAYRDWRNRRLGVVVTMGIGFFARGPLVGPASLMIEATNRGEREIRISGVGVLLPDGERIQMRPPDLPYDLPGGRTYHTGVELEYLLAELPRHGYSGHIRLRAFAQNDAGGRDVSQAKYFDVGTGRLWAPRWRNVARLLLGQSVRNL